MHAGQATSQGIDDAALGQPARFDAEPVRRKSRRWIFVVFVLFVAIAGAVGLAVSQGRAYFKAMAAEREAKQKREQDENSTGRRRKVFELGGSDADLPDRFGKPKEELPPPIPVIRGPDPGVPPPLAQPGAQPALGGRGAPSISMFVATAPAEGAAASVAPEASPAPAPLHASPASAPAGPLDALQRPSGSNAGSAPRARAVQEQARRAAPSSVTGTDQALAAHLGNRSYLLPRGAVMPCTLLTQLDSTVRGPAACLVSQNIYSDDGRLLLIERGSTVSGEYGAAALKNGDRRLAIVWRRIRTPHGVVIDVDSPAADSVGTVGVDGHVDNHWFERIGAALMLSLIDDAIQLQVARQGAEAAGGNGATQPYQATTGTTKSIAERVLESTINIPPTITKNRGERLLVVLNRDLWFDQVYEARPR